ncbi:MAG TPA: hypothetical protein VJS64_15955, partial [Pyrinomonadaceae bacterium]|nr:hypothetical protein [Pyrinomonadaceae bacterium]
MNFSVKTRLSLILFLAGFAGVVSILLIDLSALIALVPVSARSNVPAITPLIKILSLIQPTVLLLVAVLTGVALSQKVGLSAPVAESIATGGRLIPALKPQLGPGFLGGLVGALAILLTTAVLRPLLTTETVE